MAVSRRRRAGQRDSGTVSGRRHPGNGVRLNAGVDDVRRQVPKLDMAALRSANKQIEGSFRRHLVALDQDADRLADGAASIDGSPQSGLGAAVGQRDRGMRGEDLNNGQGLPVQGTGLTRIQIQCRTGLPRRR